MLAALIINENVVRWALAVKIGGHSIASGFADAFDGLTLGHYLFFLAFRLVPYIGLELILIFLSKTKMRDFVISVFSGGLIGILIAIISGLWYSQRAIYTGAHVRSTYEVGFMAASIWACLYGGVGTLAFAAFYAPFHFWKNKDEKAEHQLPPSRASGSVN